MFAPSGCILSSRLEVVETGRRCGGRRWSIEEKLQIANCLSDRELEATSSRLTPGSIELQVAGAMGQKTAYFGLLAMGARQQVSTRQLMLA
jgi:hypothetical protein